MSYTSQILFVSRDQSFDINVTGLLPATYHYAYFEGRKVAANQIRPLSGKLGDPLITDANGTLNFVYYYSTGLSDAPVTSLDAFYAATNSLAGSKEFVVANINTTTLPDNYIDTCTSHSKSIIQVSIYNPTAAEFEKGFGDK